MKKLILFIVLACVSCFAYSRVSVEYRDCKFNNNSSSVMFSCKIYAANYAQNEETSYIGSYNFMTDTDLYFCTENISLIDVHKHVVNAFTGGLFVKHSVYDKYGVRIEHTYIRIDNFCADKYKRLIKYVD